MWTKEQFAKHPNHDSLIGVNKKLQSNASPIVNKITVAAPVAPAESVNDSKVLTFSIPGKPVGKPRMTQRDKWQKRPCVLRYREFCDRARLALLRSLPDAKAIERMDCYFLHIVAHIAVTSSWKESVKAALIGKPHRAKPDTDNIVKAVADGLFEEDSGIWDERGRKYWCVPGQERVDVEIRFL